MFLGLFSLPVWVVLVLLAIVLLFVYGSSPMRTWKHLGVPGPHSQPFVGNFHQFYSAKQGMRASFDRWQQRYGKVFGIHYFRKPCLVVQDTDLLKEIFVKDFNTFYDRFFLADGLFFPDDINNGVFFQRGPDWRRIRRTISSSFASGKLKTLTKHMNTSARQLAEKFVDHAKVESQPIAKTIFGAYSLDVIAGSLFSLKIDSQRNPNSQFFKMVQSLFNPTPVSKLATVLAGVFPSVGYVMKTMGVSIFNPQAVGYFKEFLRELISERKNNEDDTKSCDTLQFLLESTVTDDSSIHEEDKKLTEEEIISQCISFLLAGYDTTSSALQFTAFLLAQNNQAQKKLLQEIESVVGDADEITYDHCQRMAYMECVINETLRLYPPVHWLKRETNKVTTLKDYTVPARTGIIIPVYNIGRDPDLFQNPDSFQPERFRSIADSAGTISFLPFGFGPKQCIGMRMGMMEIKIALVHTLRKVKFVDVTPKSLDFDDFTGILVPKTQLKLSLCLHNNSDN